jgi:hypothetical protein
MSSEKLGRSCFLWGAPIGWHGRYLANPDEPDRVDQ